MKLSPVAAVIAASALIAVSTLGMTGAASAATPGSTYVLASGIASSPAPGTPGLAYYNGTGISSGLNGLAVTGGTHINAELATPLDAGTGTAFSDFRDSVYFWSPSLTDTLPLLQYFSDGVADVRVLVPDLSGTAAINSVAALWSTSIAIGAIPANTSVTLATFDAQMALVLPNATITGFELYSSSPTTITAMAADSQLFVFLPAPVPSAPTSISLANLTGPGITVTTSGFVPNESVDVYFSDPNSGGQIDTVVADANGELLFTYVGPASSPLGDYNLTFVGSVPNFQTFDFAVVATALAATGLDLTVPVIGCAILLLGGAALALIAARRRTHA